MSAFARYWRTRKPFFSFLAGVALIVFAYAAAAEIVLRFLPVATGLNPLPTDAAQPILHFEPGFHYTYSRGWDLRGANRGRVNNAGWVNDQDYRRDNTRPLIAVIGNSYIEAQMVPYGDTLQARLAAALSGSYRVYSFAASGAPLAQYAVYARHAVQEYHAQALVIVVTAFIAAEGPRAAEPGLWYYAPDGGGLALHLLPYRRGWAVRLARDSTLLRYLVFNLNIVPRLGVVWHRLLYPWASAPEPHETVPPEQRKANSDAVVDAFLRDLGAMTGLPPERVLFVIDGFRYPVVAEAQRRSAAAASRADFIAAATARGYAVADTDPLFFQRYRESGTRFEADALHWNAAGHAVAADTVLASPWLAEIRHTMH